MKNIILIVPMIIVLSACAPIGPRLPGGTPLPGRHLNSAVINVNNNVKISQHVFVVAGVPASV